MLRSHYRGVVEVLPFKPADLEVEKRVERKHAKLTRDNENAKNLKMIRMEKMDQNLHIYM